MSARRVIELVRQATGDRCVVAGAVALNAYGLGRFTADLDFAVPDSVQSALVEALERAGFQTLHRSAAFSNHLHPELGRVDFIYLDERTEEVVFGAARETRVADEALRVPAPEHLVAMKAQAIRGNPSRRLKDLADIKFLLQVPGVDLAKARGYIEAAGLGAAWDEVAPEKT